MWKKVNYPALSLTSWLPFTSAVQSSLMWFQSSYCWRRQTGHTDCIFGLVLIGDVEQSAAKETLKWRCNVASMFLLELRQKWIRILFCF